MKNIITFIMTFVLITNNWVMVSYSDLDIALRSEESVSKISEEIFSVAANQEKIPVCIWYEDINQSEVEHIVEEKIGYKKSDIMTNLPSINQEAIEELYLVNSNYKLDSSDPILSDYFNLNKELIEQEKEKTDIYISERRELAKEMYIDKSQTILDEIAISSSVDFVSKYAPMFIAELTMEEIERISYLEYIDSIEYLDNDIVAVECTDGDFDVESYITSSRISEIHETTGLSGKNVKVGIFEAETLLTHAELPSTRFSVVTDANYSSGHATRMARIFGGSQGIAPEVSIYSASNQTKIDGVTASQAATFYYCIEKLIEQKVSVINCSFSFLTFDEAYHTYDKWIDHVAITHNVSFVSSAGNIRLNPEEDNYNPYGKIGSPGKAYNVITVGACNNMFTEDISDDIMFYDSCYNETKGCAKPDIAVCSNIMQGGTSAAAAVTTGTIALMLQLRPSLAAYPEAVKAILMASCQYKALPYGTETQESMDQGITDKQGAGVLSPYLAICITAQGSYGTGVLNDGGINNINFYQPKYNAGGMNFSLSWLKNNTTTACESGGVTNKDISQIGIALRHNNNNIKTYASDNSSALMIYYSGLDDASINYSAMIFDLRTDNESTRYGYAWCTDNEMYQMVDEFEGLYYIKSANSDNYLTYNFTTNNYNLTTLSDLSNQLFVIKKGIIYNVLNGNETGTGIYYNNDSVVSSSSLCDVLIKKTSVGNYEFKMWDGLAYSLDNINGSDVKWTYSPSATNSEWVLEKIAYRLGDVNRDSVINSTDANLILKYASRVITLNNSQMFLADINGDDIVDSEDSLKVLKIAAKIN